MFHMLSCFNLRAETSIGEYQLILKKFEKRMLELDLIRSIGKIGERQFHPVMDTDSTRNHQYFFTITFKDRDQCDKAVEHIYLHKEPSESIHHAIYFDITDSIFICWQDI